jgi:hypothetical protein
MTEPERPADAPPRSRRFPTTRWSVVRAAGGTESPEARAALECLCKTYWALAYLLDVLTRRHRASSLERP